MASKKDYRWAVQLWKKNPHISTAAIARMVEPPMTRQAMHTIIRRRVGAEAMRRREAARTGKE